MAYWCCAGTPDQVRINLRIHDQLGDPPSDDWTLTFGGRSVDQTEVRAFIESQFPKQDQFVLDERRYQYSWGSSAMVWSFVVEMAPTVGSVIAAGIAGGAAWDGVKGIGKRLPSLWGGRETDEPLAITDDSARREAIRLVRERYRLEPDSVLTPVSITSDLVTLRSTVVLDARTGNRYEVELLRTASGVSLARITVTESGS
ncbi:hypothetical protein O3I_034240 [Nocardia brasiliensis ATCC 700358]|uniref:Uncharacterized protein n=1 Tax=Nocardia brasiliensis (strain ATCC 700358 / HUJEG-1) TaxID=1133849 RepID=K0F582_NOCB7|nr:hypothetical protein O3I_034240 [Nocardia brasiliensis ATCC 700358]